MRKKFLTVLLLLCSASLFGTENERDSSLNRIRQKIAKKQPLVVHVFVPLCDNEHQGIVPVNSTLGDGMNLRTNLYWGAGYGVRSYFKLKTDWKLLKQIANPSGDILERVVFKKTLTNGAKVYIVADAFRGDRMKASLQAFFGSLSGTLRQKVQLDSLNAISISSEADLLVFNGHDGLMDDTLSFPEKQHNIKKDVMVIACYSKSFFNDAIRKAGGYPLLMTTGLLAPEAYVMHAAIEQWASLASGEIIRNSAATAYQSKHPSSSITACRNLFCSGW